MTANKVQKKKVSQFWKQELEVIDREASQSEIVACIENMMQFWQREASQSEIVACAKNVAQFWQREASQSEIVAFVTELIEQNWRLIEKVKQYSFMRDRLRSSLENLVAETIGEGEHIGQTAVQTVEEDKPNAFTLSIAVTEVNNIENNYEKESFKGDRDLEAEFTTQVDSENQTVKEIIDSVDGLTSIASPPDDSPLFHGDVDIVIAPPVDIAQLVRFERTLRSVPSLNISCTTGHRNGHPVITVVIIQPLPLISLLNRMPEVEKAELWVGEEADDDDLLRGLVFDSERKVSQESIIVTLKQLGCNVT